MVMNEIYTSFRGVVKNGRFCRIYMTQSMYPLRDNGSIDTTDVCAENMFHHQE